MKTLTASDRSSLIKLASALPAGDENRRAILSGLKESAGPPWNKNTKKKKKNKKNKILPPSKKKILKTVKKTISGVPFLVITEEEGKLVRSAKTYDEAGLLEAIGKFGIKWDKAPKNRGGFFRHNNIELSAVRIRGKGWNIESANFLTDAELKKLT